MWRAIFNGVQLKRRARDVRRFVRAHDSTGVLYFLLQTARACDAKLYKLIHHTLSPVLLSGQSNNYASQRAWAEKYLQTKIITFDLIPLHARKTNQKNGTGDSFRYSFNRKLSLWSPASKTETDFRSCA